MPRLETWDQTNQKENNRIHKKIEIIILISSKKAPAIIANGEPVLGKIFPFTMVILRDSSVIEML